MSRSILRIPIFSTLSLLLLAAVIVLWCRSPRHADLVTFYTPAGHLAGLASERNGLLLCTTEIPFGSEMGLSAQTMSASRDEFGPVHDLLFDPSNEKWHFLGFHTATGTVSTWNWKYSALIIPYWALIIPLTILPFMGFRRLIVRHRRKRRGQCLACGYDLRQSPDRCPECGRPVAGPARDNRSGLKAITPGGALSWLIVGFLLAANISALARGRREAHKLATDPPEQVVLHQVIGPIDLQDLTPMNAVRAVAREGNVRLEPSGIDFDSPEDWPHSRLVLKDVTLDTALRMSCLPWCWAVGEPVQLWTSGTTVHLSPASQAPRTVRCYRVNRILADVQTYLDRAAEDDGYYPMLRGTVGSRVFTGQMAPPTSASQELAGAMTALVRDTDWVDNGGNLGAMWIDSGQLWVCQTQEGHAAVRVFLAMLQGSDHPPTDPVLVENHADLHQIIPELKLESTTLEHAIDMLRDTTDSNIVVYWNDLEKLGIKRDAPINVHLWHVSLDRALDIALILGGADDASTLRAVQDGIIVVASPERLRTGGLVAIRMYDVRDLIDMIRIEPEVATAATRPVNRDAIKPRTVSTSEEAAEELIRLIEDTVDTDTWKDNGGSIGMIRELAGRLIITQTPANHRKIVNLLRTLRSGGGKEGTDLSGPPSKP